MGNAASLSTSYTMGVHQSCTSRECLTVWRLGKGDGRVKNELRAGFIINKYGAHFYHEAPTKVVLALMKTDRGWQVATE